MGSVYLLGVRVDDLSLNQAVGVVKEWLKGGGKHVIFTPNPEFLVKANEDLGFKALLNSSNLNIPDGQGLKLGGIKNTTTGVDLMEKLIKLSAQEGFTIALLGGQDGVAEKLKERLLKLHPDLKITYSGPELKGNLEKTDMVFVAYGMGKQERWIEKNLDQLPVKVMMGVGGSFDYLSGKVTRAPKFLRGLGLEWLFRLIIQPWRIKRQSKLLKYLYLLAAAKT